MVDRQNRGGGEVTRGRDVVRLVGARVSFCPLRWDRESPGYVQPPGRTTIPEEPVSVHRTFAGLRPTRPESGSVLLLNRCFDSPCAYLLCPGCYPNADGRLRTDYPRSALR